MSSAAWVPVEITGEGCYVPAMAAALAMPFRLEGEAAYRLALIAAARFGWYAAVATPYTALLTGTLAQTARLAASMAYPPHLAGQSARGEAARLAAGYRAQVAATLRQGRRGTGQAAYRWPALAAFARRGVTAGVIATCPASMRAEARACRAWRAEAAASYVPKLSARAARPIAFPPRGSHVYQARRTSSVARTPCRP
jgi:hypothetical protein